MKSLKDIQELSLQMTVATLRDAQEIEKVDLQKEIIWLKEQTFPSFIVHLCKLGKQIETSLITGKPLTEIPDVFPLQAGSSMPEFCYSLLSQIFTESGRPRYILDIDHIESTPTGCSPHLKVVDSDGNRHMQNMAVAEKSASVVMLLRQIFLLFSKAADLPTIASLEDELSAFRERMTPKEYLNPIRLMSDKGHLHRLGLTLSMAKRLLALLLTPEKKLHPSLEQWLWLPFGAHGPGAVAKHERGREKWNFECDGRRLPTSLYQDSHGHDIRDVKEEIPPLYSRLCVVPKDFRGHRLICAEPKELQFAQQGLLRVFEHIIASSYVINRHISLKHQEYGFYKSRNLRCGTIDLKDASDRLSLPLLKALLPKEVFSVVTRFRSDGIVFPDGTIMKPYNAAFTMGNALCFPMETLVFWSLTCGTILAQEPKLWKRTIISDDEFARIVRGLDVRVFGDDIIAPIEWVGPIAETLSDVGLVVNTTKTCVLSLVRESCGSWWYAGYDCRITKLKFATTIDLESWTGFIDVIPHLRENALYNTASVLEVLCRKYYPTSEMVKSLLVEHSIADTNTFLMLHYGVDVLRKPVVRFNKELFRLEYRRPLRCADDTIALPGRLGILAWWTRSATRFLNTDAQRIKFRWVELI